MGNKELFKTVLFGGFQKEEVWNYMQEVEAEIEGDARLRNAHSRNMRSSWKRKT